MEVSLQILSVLFCVSIIAGWIDAVAGGGGLITLTALLLTGMPPASAIATNKLSGSFGTMASSFYCIRQGVVSLRKSVVPLLTTGMGSVLGGWVLLRVDVAYLGFAVPLLLIAIGVYFLFFGHRLNTPSQPKISQARFDATAAPALGFYDGFFGPGAGSMMATAYVTQRGMAIREATAHAKLLNFSSNITALLYFVFFGSIVWLCGAAMIAGQMLGSYLGARTALKAGAQVIRPMTVLVCFAVSGNMIMDWLG